VLHDIKDTQETCMKFLCGYKQCYCRGGWRVGGGTNDCCYKHLQTHSLHINNPSHEDTWSI